MFQFSFERGPHGKLGIGAFYEPYSGSAKTCFVLGNFIVFDVINKSCDDEGGNGARNFHALIHT